MKGKAGARKLVGHLDKHLLGFLSGAVHDGAVWHWVVDLMRASGIILFFGVGRIPKAQALHSKFFSETKIDFRSTGRIPTTHALQRYNLKLLRRGVMPRDVFDH